MPLFSTTHSCGLTDHRFFLSADVESRIVKCYRCGRGVLARQVRDKAMVITPERDGVRGIGRRDS